MSNGSKAEPRSPTQDHLIRKVSEVLESVCQKCDFSFAEALCPRADGHCLVQTPATFCINDDCKRFHQASSEFVFPLQIGIPGRVWKHKNIAWHGDVSTLPSTIYLRSELAHQAKLKGCVAVPIQVRDTSTFYVALFYSQRILDQRDIAEKALEACRLLLEPTKDPQMVIPQPTPGDPAVVIGSRSVLSKSRSWLKCELALQKPEEQRASEDVEDIMKFTRRLEFFKHMAEGQRYLLCQKMTLQRINSGVILHRSSDAPDPSLWRIVVLGRIAVQVTEPYGNPTYPVWHFDSGQTFSKTYLNLFINDVGIRAHIETVTQCQCLEVRIPPQMREEFKAWTRPLWYEELTRYFGVSINEAGEALGMCTSAIKKICRRHGIARWPHRKIASVEKTISTLQARIQELEFDSVNGDEEQLGALRTELMDAVRQRMQCGCNRAPLPLSGGVDDDDDDDDDGEAKPARQKKGGKGGEAAMDVDGQAYTGQHPVEFGIMQHQLADMHATVPIFDDEVTKNESPSDAPDQSPSSRDVNGISPLPPPSGEPSQAPRRTRSFEAVDEYDEQSKRRSDGHPRHIPISEASSELMANMFGTAGLPAVGHWEFNHHNLQPGSSSALFNHGPGGPPGQQAGGPQAGGGPGAGVGNGGPGAGWGGHGSTQGYSVLADSLVNSKAFGAEGGRFPPGKGPEHQSAFRGPGGAGPGINGGKGGGAGGRGHGPGGGGGSGEWNGAGAINGNGRGPAHAPPGAPAVAPCPPLSAQRSPRTRPRRGRRMCCGRVARRVWGAGRGARRVVGGAETVGSRRGSGRRWWCAGRRCRRRCSA